MSPVVVGTPSRTLHRGVGAEAGTDQNSGADVRRAGTLRYHQAWTCQRPHARKFLQSDVRHTLAVVSSILYKYHTTHTFIPSSSFQCAVLAVFVNQTKPPDGPTWRWPSIVPRQGGPLQRVLPCQAVQMEDGASLGPHPLFSRRLPPPPRTIDRPISCA